MGVFQRVKRASGLSSETLPYTCLERETQFNVQHHACPVCDTYDIRRLKWVNE